MDELLTEYKTLINQTLPSRYQSPVRFNHCFARIILDWLFEDVWYHHLDRKKRAVSQLSNEQLQRAIQRMNEWLIHHQALVTDNFNSLRYRRKIK